MNMRNIFAIILAAFVVASVVYLVAHESGEMERGESDGPAPGGSGAAGDPSAAEPADVVIAYYFHGDKRCRTCLAIEAYTKEAIESGFGDRIESGELELRIVNVDEPQNEHFIEDYGLTTKSVIIAEFRGGVEQRWKNLDKIWEYVGDKEVFLDYVRGETEAYIGGGPE